MLAVPAGCGLAALLATQIGAPRVFAHTPFDADLARPDGVHVALAAGDHDVPDRAAAIWPGAGATVLRRQRRIDTLYGDRTIGLIVLAVAADPASVLDGAAAVLARDHPVVLAAQGVAREPIQRRLPLHTGHLAGDIACFLPPNTALPTLPPSDHPVSIIITFDQSLVGAGFHPAEHDNPRGGRWSGAAVAAWFAMPRAVGPHRLRLDIADWGIATTGLALRIEGATHTPSRQGAMTADFGPIEVAPSDQPLRIRLLTPPAERDMRRGPRRIGIRLLRATLHPAF